MIIILTIIIAIIIIWSLCSAILLLDDTNHNDLLERVATIYWYGVGITIIVATILDISFIISTSIVCKSKHNDYPICERQEQK